PWLLSERSGGVIRAGAPASRYRPGALCGGSALLVEHEPDAELEVDRFQVRIVLADLVARRATEQHLADVTDGEPAFREHGLTAEDTIVDDELCSPALEGVVRHALSAMRRSNRSFPSTHAE